MGVRSWLAKRFAMDRSPWGSYWFEPVGVHTTAGLRVTADASMQLSAVFACVRIISQQFASLPFCLYRNRSDGGKDKVTGHPVYALIARRPNPFQNGFEWREMLAGHLALRGNAYCQIVADARGQIQALIPLHPDRVKILLQASGDYAYQYTNLKGEEVIYSRGEIWHLRGLSADGVIGLSPIALARESVGGSIAAQNYSARFFANDATPAGGWIEYPGTFKDKMAREQFRESLQEAQAGVNRGKVAVFEYGMKYHQLSVTPDDAQFLETRKWQVNDIARWFGVPPHKIGDLSAATNNNIEQQAQEFVQETLGPMAERWESSIEADLLFDDEGLEAEFLFSQLLRGDSVGRATRYQMGIMAGWMTRNEARIAENMNPLPGLDAPLVPLNMSEEGAPPQPAPGKPSARLEALLRVNAAGIARRAMDSPITKDDAQRVAASLAISLEDAAAWCAALTPAMAEDEMVESLVALALR